MRRTEHGCPVFCVGLAKSGTHSVAEMLSGACRAAHEPDFPLFLALLSGVRGGKAPVPLLREFLVERHARLGLDVEVSHLLSSFVPHLLDAFPDSRYILLVRDCRTWIDSMINDQLNIRHQYPWSPGRWQGAYDEYMAAGRRPFAPQEEPLRELSLYPLASYVEFWREEIRSVKEAVPDERLLLLGTHEIATSAERIAEFVGVPVRKLDLDRSHAFQTPKPHGVLDRLDPEFVTAQLSQAVAGSSQSKSL